MNKENVFTSTGVKFLHHPEAILKVQLLRTAIPISVQIAPTSRCNLSCVFCSNVNRDKHEDLGNAALQNLIKDLLILKTKTIEWTGGGDPTQYEYINEAVNFASDLGFKQGMISNGIAIKDKIDSYALNRLTWLRISMNCLDYVDDIQLPFFAGTLGFSYVMNKNTTEESLEKLQGMIEKYRPMYVRVVPDCQVSLEEQIDNNAKYSKTIKEWGEPYFYQAKIFNRPKACWWGYFKPFVLHDGWVYRCSSVVLNDEADRQFHEKYRWFPIEDFRKVYEQPMKSFTTEHCSHCVFSNQNDMVEGLLFPDNMKDFI